MHPLRFFKDILDLPYDEDTDIVDMGALVEAFPTVPAQVLEQVFSDHGRKPEFQTEYGNLDLDSVDWHLLALPAVELAASGFMHEFTNWPRQVMERPQLFPKLRWASIDLRERIQNHWETTGTWEIPPVLINGPLVHAETKWRVMEGHTRIGLLDGLLRYGILPPDALHQAWCGVARRSTVPDQLGRVELSEKVHE